MNKVFIGGCGSLKRTLIRDGNTYYAGCFVGSKKELIKAIKKNYRGKKAKSYVDKVLLLDKMTIANQSQNFDRNYVIEFAISNSNYELAKLIILQSPVSCLQETEKLVRYFEGDFDVVKYLLDSIDDASNYLINQLLVTFATKGDLDAVRYLIDKGADIYYANSVAFRLASEYGQLEIVKYLMSLGVNLHIDDDFATIWAASNGHLEIIKYFISKSNNIDLTKRIALRQATFFNHYDLKNYLKSI